MPPKSILKASKTTWPALSIQAAPTRKGTCRSTVTSALTQPTPALSTNSTPSPNSRERSPSTPRCNTKVRFATDLHILEVTPQGLNLKTGPRPSTSFWWAKEAPFTKPDWWTPQHTREQGPWREKGWRPAGPVAIAIFTPAAAFTKSSRPTKPNQPFSSIFKMTTTTPAKPTLVRPPPVAIPVKASSLRAPLAGKLVNNQPKTTPISSITKPTRSLDSNNLQPSALSKAPVRRRPAQQRNS